MQVSLQGEVLTKSQIVERYLLAQGENAPRSIQAIADICGTGYSLVIQIRRRLIKEGRIPNIPIAGGPRIPTGNGNLGGRPARHKPVSPEEIMRRVLAGEVEPISKDQRKQILSEYIRTSPAFVTKGMIETLTKLESGDGETELYTPPSPMTVGEAVERTSRILKAYGPQIAALAWMRAFNEPVLPVVKEPDAPHVPLVAVEGSQQGSESDARVQDGLAALGQFEGSASDESEASHCNRVERAAQEEPGRVSLDG